MFRGRSLTWIVLVVLSALLAYGCFLVLRPFFAEIFLATVLAIVFFPIHSWLVRKTKSDNLAAWISTLGAGLLFLFPLTMLGIVLSREARHAVDAMSAAIGPSGSLEWFDRAVNFLSDQLGWDPAQTQDFLKSKLSGIGSSLLSNAVKSLQGLGSWLFSSITTLVTMFFLFRGGSKFLEESKSWVPLPPDMMDILFAETRLQIFANVYGVISVAVAQGTLTAIGFALCGLPSAILWGAMAALFSVVPVVGAALVWVPGVLYLAASGTLGKAGLLLIWGTLLISMADNVIRPIVLSEKAQMNTAVMFFALLGGIDAFGLVGLFAGPIVFSLALAVIKLLREHSSALGMNVEVEGIGI
ncbi:AI-2E family transporter [Bryobacter aggregatus]|uniref:AI-2E family transporter n=1 Tax=Bryobacter aggregatus TaxID=360054 RepID=UPI0004E13B71|nr:AI-2E family transporter [Bryobacter aggregatus]